MCGTWNWSHPYENIPEAQGDRNGTAGGSTWQFHLQNGFNVSKALWGQWHGRSVLNSSPGTWNFTPQNNPCPLPTESQCKGNAGWVSQRVVMDFNQPFGPYTLNNEDCDFLGSVCCNPLQELEKPCCPAQHQGSTPQSFSFGTIGKWLSNRINQLNFHKR